jgi:hypothetical protein
MGPRLRRDNESERGCPLSGITRRGAGGVGDSSSTSKKSVGHAAQAMRSGADQSLQLVQNDRATLSPHVEWLCSWWRKYQKTVCADDVQELLAAYALADKWGQDHILATAKQQAARHTAARPTLHLVSNSPD